MPNIITITGANGAGKSTIAEELLKEMDFKYTHFSNPKDMEDGKKQYYDFLDNLDNKNYLCDRFFEGEWIYAPIYRKYEPNYLRDIENKIAQNNNFLFIYVTADLNKIIERIDIRGEDFMKREHLGLERELFDKFIFQTQRLPFLQVDTTKTPLNDNLILIKESYNKLLNIYNNIRRCNLCNDVLDPVPLPRGNLQAKYFIVGQNPGGRGQKKGKVYYNVFGGGGTSEFLNEVLIKANIYKECWFTNIVLCSTSNNSINKCQVNNCLKNLDLQLNLIKPQKIIALGNETYKYLKENYTEYEIINAQHPTFIKRFFSNKEEKINDYVNLFKEV